MKEVIRVLVAEDHSIVRQGLVALIGRKRNLKVVAEAANGSQAIQQFQRHRPDICLIDLRMPEMDGLAVIRSICEKNANAKIIVLTTFDDDEDIYQALRYGAKAYLLKDISSKALVDTIISVHQGSRCITPEVGARLASRTRDSELSRRELDVLQLLMAGKSNKEIGAALNVTEGTIKIHVSHIFRKLKATARTEAVRVALKRGLIRLD